MVGWNLQGVLNCSELFSAYKDCTQKMYRWRCKIASQINRSNDYKSSQWRHRKTVLSKFVATMTKTSGQRKNWDRAWHYQTLRWHEKEKKFQKYSKTLSSGSCSSMCREMGKPSWSTGKMTNNKMRDRMKKARLFLRRQKNLSPPLSKKDLAKIHKKGLSKL